MEWYNNEKMVQHNDLDLSQCILSIQNQSFHDLCMVGR